VKLTIEEVRHAAALARLGMTAAELELMRDQLSHILESFDALGQVDTDGVEPTRHSVDVDSVMRDDQVRDSLPREDVLSNAPSKEGDFVRVRAVLGDH
jgi:aspartyl-tRNA(Asn)/glutamyl-tRNA(Gln) amidotransferase subunit C